MLCHDCLGVNSKPDFRGFSKLNPPIGDFVGLPGTYHKVQVPLIKCPATNHIVLLVDYLLALRKFSEVCAMIKQVV